MRKRVMRMPRDGMPERFVLLTRQYSWSIQNSEAMRAFSRRCAALSESTFKVESTRDRGETLETRFRGSETWLLGNKRNDECHRRDVPVAFKAANDLVDFPHKNTCRSLPRHVRSCRTRRRFPPALISRARRLRARNPFFVFSPSPLRRHRRQRLGDLCAFPGVYYSFPRRRAFKILFFPATAEFSPI